MTMQAWMRHPRYISSCGGTRSGKTYSILQVFICQLLGEEQRGDAPTINSVVSETYPHLKRGAIRDFKAIMQGFGYWHSENWSETDKIYRFANGSVLEFFSADNAGKVYGSARCRLFLNEAQHIDWETARQLFVRTSGLIVIDYNPTHEFWAMTRIENKDNCIRIHSTYRDNEFLTAAQVREIEDQRGDKNWWKVFGEGEVGTLDGLIYEFDLCDALPPVSEGDRLTEVQGLDFGFTNDPTARVQVVADARVKEMWVRERCYRTHMRNADIVDDLRGDGVGRYVPIYADCAEPKSIADIASAGFRVEPCDKDAPVRSEKLRFQLQWMQGWKMHFTKDSVNLIHEARNYCWLKDANGNPTNTPIDKYNHLLDALRYAVWTKFGRDAGSGEYRVSFNGRKKDERRHY